jgi:chromosome segregation ATPase
LKKEVEEALSKAESTVVVQKGQINLLKEDISKLQTKLTKTEAKLEEVTVSEQELAWQNHALSVTGQMYAKSGHPDSSGQLEQIKTLEKEREDLRETVNKLSVKLYKVVGFLDEMVQEQEAIITETMTRDALENSAAGPSEQQQPSEDRFKLLSNVTGMKEQIIGVIDSVIEGMPQSIEDDVVNQVCTTLHENKVSSVLP